MATHDSKNKKIKEVIAKAEVGDIVLVYDGRTFRDAHREGEKKGFTVRLAPLLS